MTEPLVSVGVAVYNGERGIRRALESLLEQDYANFEIVISDNASTDNTRIICAEYAARDSRIRYYRNARNIGAPANFNRAFALSIGEYFMWASHDDYRRPWFISACLRELLKSDRVVLVGAECDCVDAHGKLLLIDHSLCTIGMAPRQRFMRYKRLLHEYDRHRGGIFYGLFRRAALARVMPLKQAMTADQNMMLELSLLGEFVTVPERLLVRRMDGASQTGLRRLARSYGITNPLLIYGVYFAREHEIAKIVLRSAQLSTKEKAQLLAWSPMHTFRAVGGRVISLARRKRAM